MEALRQLRQLIAVRHPHLDGALDALKQAVDVRVDAALGCQLGGAVLAVNARDDVILVQTVGELLLAVAYAQDWHAQVEEGWVGVGGALIVDGVGSTAEDDAHGLELELGELGCAGQHLRVDIELAETADDAVVDGVC